MELSKLSPELGIGILCFYAGKKKAAKADAFAACIQIFVKSLLKELTTFYLKLAITATKKIAHKEARTSKRIIKTNDTHFGLQELTTFFLLQ